MRLTTHQQRLLMMAWWGYITGNEMHGGVVYSLYKKKLLTRNQPRSGYVLTEEGREIVQKLRDQYGLGPTEDLDEPPLPTPRNAPKKNKKQAFGPGLGRVQRAIVARALESDNVTELHGPMEWKAAQGLVRRRKAGTRIDADGRRWIGVDPWMFQ